MRALLTSVVVALLISGCNLTPAAAEAPLKERLMLQSFELKSVNGESLENLMGEHWDAARRPSIEFQQDFLLAGQSGCNRFFGQGVLEGLTLKMKSGGSTRMMCTPPQMKLEQTILSTLKGGAKASLTGETLTLKTAKNELKYQRVYR